MKNNSLKYTAVAGLAITVAGGAYFYSQNHDSFSADITEEQSSVNIENSIEQNTQITTDVLTKTEIDIAETLDISSLKKESTTDEFLDITEHKAIETSEIFGVIRTNLAFQIKGNTALGGLSFDTVYGQEFLDENEEINEEEINNYIEENISFSTKERSCELTSTYIPHDKNAESLSTMVNDSYSFSLMVTCPEVIENAIIENNIFYEENTAKAHFVQLYTRKRTTIKNLKSQLLTPLIPTLEWNTDKEIPEIDSDNDGLLDREEEIYKTDKNLSDTDGDGDSDYKEIERGTNPLVPHTY